MRSIYQEVEYIFILYDEITGRTVNRNMFKVYNSLGKQAFYKGSGIYIFISGKDSKYMVTIEGNGYQTQRLFMDEKNRGGIYRIWMMPSQKNEKLSQMTLLTGKAERGLSIKVICGGMEQCRLLGRLQPGYTCVNLYHLQHSTMEGKELRIENTEMGYCEDILLGESFVSQEKGYKYQLIRPVQHKYEAGHTRIYKTATVLADEQGRFFAAFRDISDMGCECIIETRYGVQKTLLQYRQICRADIEEKTKEE